MTVAVVRGDARCLPLPDGCVDLVVTSPPYFSCSTDLPGPAANTRDQGALGRAGELPPMRPAVVLDPFGGTGTTALVASMLGRHGVSVDRSADYCRIAAWRTHDPAERAKALQVPKPPPVVDGQEALFPL